LSLFSGAHGLKQTSLGMSAKAAERERRALRAKEE
jgi:hypothetical protein